MMSRGSCTSFTLQRPPRIGSEGWAEGQTLIGKHGSGTRRKKDARKKKKEVLEKEIGSKEKDGEGMWKGRGIRKNGRNSRNTGQGGRKRKKV